jgi:hypothetical protein
MNKSTKIAVNYVVGACVSILLLWCIYKQVSTQLAGVNGAAWKKTGWNGYLMVSVLLVFANIPLEGYKWYTLARSVEPVSYLRALGSLLAGIAFSIVTPNRSGDYPGRILFLSKGDNNTLRYVNVAVLGVMSQLSAIFIFGLAGLICYNVLFPSLYAKAALFACIAGNIFIAVIYWNFEAWLPAMERIKWLRKFAIYGRLLNKVSTMKQVKVLGMSLLRFAIFTAQYLFLLRWMNVDMPFIQGYFLAALFFWVMAVTPSIALAELGVRGAVCLLLFRHYSSNNVGMLAATAGIWVLNLIIPSIVGSVLVMRMRLLR